MYNIFFSCFVETQHKFSATESYWGFKHFMPFTNLSPKNNSVLGDTMYLVAKVVPDIINQSHDLEQTFSLFRLVNQLDAIQTLFHIQYFRKVRYNALSFKCLVKILILVHY